MERLVIPTRPMIRRAACGTRSKWPACNDNTRRSSDGRAPGWGPGGRPFDPGRLDHDEGARSDYTTAWPSGKAAGRNPAQPGSTPGAVSNPGTPRRPPDDPAPMLPPSQRQTRRPHPPGVGMQLDLEQLAVEEGSPQGRWRPATGPANDREGTPGRLRHHARSHRLMAGRGAFTVEARVQFPLGVRFAGGPVTSRVS